MQLVCLKSPGILLFDFIWCMAFFFRYQSYLKNISLCRKTWMKWFCPSNWSHFIWVSITINQLTDMFLLNSTWQVRLRHGMATYSKGPSKLCDLVSHLCFVADSRHCSTSQKNWHLRFILFFINRHTVFQNVLSTSGCLKFHSPGFLLTLFPPSYTT